MSTRILILSSSRLQKEEDFFFEIAYHEGVKDKNQTCKRASFMKHKMLQWADLPWLQNGSVGYVECDVFEVHFNFNPFSTNRMRQELHHEPPPAYISPLFLASDISLAVALRYTRPGFAPEGLNLRIQWKLVGWYLGSYGEARHSSWRCLSSCKYVASGQS